MTRGEAEEFLQRLPERRERLERDKRSIIENLECPSLQIRALRLVEDDAIALSKKVAQARLSLAPIPAAEDADAQVKKAVDGAESAIERLREAADGAA